MIYIGLIRLVFVDLLPNVVHALDLIHFCNVLVLGGLLLLYSRFELLAHEILFRLENLALYIKAIIFHLVDLLVPLVEVVKELFKYFLRHFLLDLFDLGTCF